MKMGLGKKVTRLWNALHWIISTQYSSLIDPRMQLKWWKLSNPWCLDQDLLMEFRAEEVTKALKQMYPKKAFVTDGIPHLFY